MMKKWKFYAYRDINLRSPQYKVTVYAEDRATAHAKATEMIGWQKYDPSLLNLREIEEVL